MNQIAKYVTPEMVEKAVGLPAGSIDSFPFLVMNQQALGVTPQAIARELEVDESELDLLADSVTGESKGLNSELWKSCVVTIRAINVGNHHVIGHGWDALEAMAVNRLAQVVQDAGQRLSTKDAVAIASLANKAVRRQAGEGSGPSKASLLIRQNGNGGQEMAFELQGGNLGSIRMSLSARVQQQLEQPRTIEGESKPAGERRMLTVEEIRNVK